MSKVNEVSILTAATATGADESHKPWNPRRTFQASGTTSSGAGSATIDIEVSNDDTNFIKLATFTLTLSTTAAAEGFYSEAPWKYIRANVTAISGTGASVDVVMASEGE